MKIVLSGTYSTGKTTTSIALSLLTGIPVTHARTMREILPAAIPGKRLEECDFHEIVELGIRRFSERVIAEKKVDASFISDGCPLQEWLYATTRMSTGLNPSETPEKILLHRMQYVSEWSVFEETIMAFGRSVKEYTKSHYDLIIHLPVEFPFDPDGHRPTSELFRQKSEELLIRTYEELGLKAFVVEGSLHARLETILHHLKIEPVMSIDEAISIAQNKKRDHFDNVKLEHELREQSGLSIGESLSPIHQEKIPERTKKERRMTDIQYLEKELIFRYKSRIESVRYDDIQFAVCEKPYIRLITKTGKKYLLEQTLKGFSVGLPPCFIHLDKSRVVNLLHTSGIRKIGVGCELSVKGTIYQVAKRRKSEVEEQFLTIKYETGGGGACGTCGLCHIPV